MGKNEIRFCGPFSKTGGGVVRIGGGVDRTARFSEGRALERYGCLYSK